MPATVRPALRTVGLFDVDEAVRNWFDRTVDAHVEDPHGGRKKVPVIFSTGERAITARTRRAHPVAAAVLRAIQPQEKAA